MHVKPFWRKIIRHLQVRLEDPEYDALKAKAEKMGIPLQQAGRIAILEWVGAAISAASPPAQLALEDRNRLDRLARLLDLNLKAVETANEARGQFEGSKPEVRFIQRAIRVYRALDNDSRKAVKAIEKAVRLLEMEDGRDQQREPEEKVG